MITSFHRSLLPNNELCLVLRWGQKIDIESFTDKFEVSRFRNKKINKNNSFNGLLTFFLFRLFEVSKTLILSQVQWKEGNFTIFPLKIKCFSQIKSKLRYLGSVEFTTVHSPSTKTPHFSESLYFAHHFDVTTTYQRFSNFALIHSLFTDRYASVIFYALHWRPFVK